MKSITDHKSFQRGSNDTYRVLHLISSLGRGGRERQLSIILSARKKEEELGQFVCVLHNSKSSYINEFNIKNVILPNYSQSHIKRLLLLNRNIRKIKPQVVYAWGNIEAVYLIILKPFHRYKIINGSVRHGINNRSFSQLFRMLILQLSSNVVANSNAGLHANWLSRGFVLHNGVKMREGIVEIRKNRHLNYSGRIKLISVANLVPYKDYFTILEALSKLKKLNINFEYKILGDGPMRKEIERRIRLLGLESTAQILGNVVEVEYELINSDIFIHSSKGEGCSNAILEAMAAGLPIVASNTGGTPEIVGSNALLFGYQKTDELYNCLVRLCGSKILREEMGIESIRLVRERFTIEKMMNNYYTIIDRIVSD